jgi:hypothetical protein
MPGALIVLAGVAVLTAGQPSISVCNGMKVDLTAISIDTVGASTPGAVTHPGDCVTFPAPPPGDYVLRFIEQAGQSAAQCVRTVALTPGTRVVVDPGDGSSCME